MDILRLTIVAIDEGIGYYVVSTQISSNDNQKATTGGNLSFLVEDASPYVIGTAIGLDLQPLEE